MANTVHLSRKLGGVWGPWTVSRKLGGTIGPSPHVYEKIAGTWVCIYSVLTSSVNSGAGASAAGSGASTSGTSTTSAVSTGTSGNASGLTYSWAYLSGDGSITCSASTSATPTFSRAFTGVGNGTTSGAITGTWRCTITETSSGATTTADCALSFTWQNTIPAFTAHNDDFQTPGSSTVAVPAGAVQLVIEVWGGGGNGGHGATGSNDHQGGGGSAGGYVKHIIALSSDSGKTVSYTVGGNSSVSATLTNGSPSLSAGIGQDGANATGTTNGTGQATGGTATGGNTTNTVGTAGQTGNTFSPFANGGAATLSFGGGGEGGSSVSDTNRNVGRQDGRVLLSWT